MRDWSIYSWRVRREIYSAREEQKLLSGITSRASSGHLNLPVAKREESSMEA